MFRAPGGSSVHVRQPGRLRRVRPTAGSGLAACGPRKSADGYYHDAAALRAMPTYNRQRCRPAGDQVLEAPRYWSNPVAHGTLGPLPSASGLERIQPRPLMPVEPNTSFGGDFYRQERKRVPRR